MNKEIEITWRNYVKNVFFVVWVLAIVMLPQVLILCWLKKLKVIFLILLLLVIVLITLIAGRWHNQDIHVHGASVNWIGRIIFVVSPFIVWKIGLIFWPNIIVSASFLYLDFNTWRKNRNVKEDIEEKTG